MKKLSIATMVAVVLADHDKKEEPKENLIDKINNKKYESLWDRLERENNRW